MLEEEHGYASVTILARHDEGDERRYKIRFEKIFIQYPYVPYYPGDEIEISYNTRHADAGYGWRFAELSEWNNFMAPELRP